MILIFTMSIGKSVASLGKYDLTAFKYVVNRCSMKC